MKIQLYKSLFRFVSFLTDKTNGMPLLVKYKLLIGTFLLSTTHAAAQKDVISINENTDPFEVEKITCYMPDETALKIDLAAAPIRVKAHVLSEDSTTLVGVSVVSQNDESHTTLTHLDGWFEIEVPLKDTLVVSYLGYETREISVIEILNNSTIIMKEDTTIQMSCYVVIVSPIKDNEK